MTRRESDIPWTLNELRSWTQPRTVSEALGDCWEWQRAKAKGYGRVTHMRVRWEAHRLSYYLDRGHMPPADRPFVTHLCDNPACINPAHLEASTHAQNLRDAADRGLMAVGEAVGSAKLTEMDVLAIRRERAGRGTTYRELAERYGVSVVSVRNAALGITWMHL